MPEYFDPIYIVMLTDATLINSVSAAVPLNNTKEHWGVVKIAQATTAGVFVAELAGERDFGGTWDQIFSVDIAAQIAADAAFAAALIAGDVELQIPPYPGPGGFIRHRVPTAITGGATHTVNSKMRRLLHG